MRDGGGEEGGRGIDVLEDFEEGDYVHGWKGDGEGFDGGVEVGEFSRGRREEGGVGTGVRLCCMDAGGGGVDGRDGRCAGEEGGGGAEDASAAADVEVAEGVGRWWGGGGGREAGADEVVAEGVHEVEEA